VTPTGAAKSCALVTALAVFAAITAAQPRPRFSPTRIIELPKPKTAGSVSFEEALVKLQPVQRFAPEPLDSEQISQLAWAGQGAESDRADLQAPAVHRPTKLYIAIRRGLFLYNPGEHSLEQVSEVDPRAQLATAVPDQRPVAEAASDIIIVGSTRNFTARRGKDTKKLMLLEAGRIAQNIQLQAAALELGSVAVGVFETGPVSRVCRLPRNKEPLYIVCVGRPMEETEEGQTVTKRAVLITASRDFRDEELFETKRILETASVETVIASSRIGPVTGMLGGTAEAAIPLGQVRVEDFDAVIFIGGIGAREYFANPVALDIARRAVEQRKILAAICIAPTILANAGLLKGLRATAFGSEKDILLISGARYTGSPLERDGLIITGRDPGAAPLFGQAIADALAGR